MGKWVLICLCCLCCIFCKSQTTGNSVLQAKIARASVGEAKDIKSVKRGFIRFTKKRNAFDPLFYLSGSLLFLYQTLFSEQIQAICAYEVSCSEYTKLSIQQKGFFIGLLSGFNQMSECMPGAKYEHDDLFINADDKIIRAIQ